MNAEHPHPHRPAAPPPACAPRARRVVRGLLPAALACLLAGPLGAQGFAGLGLDAAGFAQVSRPAALDFPRDHGAHPDYRIEWWYLTAVLEDAAGAPLGLQWTLFRQATDPAREGTGWEAPQFWMAHAAVTTPEIHVHAERLARGETGQAGVTAAPFVAWIDDWAMESAADADADPLDRLRVRAAGARFAYDLAVTAHGPLVLHGEAGFSLKSDRGQASYYYSQPFYRAEGVITLDGVEIAVSGTAWLDREWSSQPLDPDQEGWDWLALHLEDGSRVMAAQLRVDGQSAYRLGTWIAPDGRATPLAPDQIALTPLARHRVADRRIPTSWRVEIPDHGLDVTAEAINPDAFMDTLVPYWEGPIRLSGSHAGMGYLEMTGY